MTSTHTATVALVGNPNVGKTTLFNALAGMRQRVGNYPGVTVEIKKGKLRHKGQTFDVIDLPGTYSLAPRSPDEMLAVEVILGRRPDEPRPDVVVALADAANLERNLYLLTQVLELGVPVVLALNMVDVARNLGLTIDPERLAKNLGVPVVPLQANKGIGIEALKDAIAGVLANPQPAAGPTFPEAFEKEVGALTDAVGESTPRYLVRRALLDVGGHMEELLSRGRDDALGERLRGARQRLAQAGCTVPGVEARTRYGWIRQVTQDCVQKPAKRHVPYTERIDRVLTHRVWGTLFFLALMFLVFQSIYTWAGPLMDVIDSGFGFLGDSITNVMTPGPLRSLLVDGVIGGVGGVLVFLPQILILFAFIAVLEDCGYMARAAFLMDRLMARCGLNGKAFIPLLSSVACAVPGIMAARVIENRRDRLATILVAPLMSCSARLPVYLLLIGAFLGPARGFSWWVPGVTLFGMYAIGLVVAPLVALLLKRSLLRGQTPVFVMEMPLYKVPSLRQVAQRSLESGWMFVRRAGTLILASMIVVWALLYFPVTNPVTGKSFDLEIAALEEDLTAPREDKEQLEKELAELQEKAESDPRSAELEKKLNEVNAALEPMEQKLRDMEQQWKGQSALGRVGKALEPAVRPLGWDWRIGMAALASFPAREVMVGTLGIIFSQGKGDAGDEGFREELGDTLRTVTWDNDPERPLFSVPVALSVMVFFSLCCQCVSTLVIIKRETASWRWPIFTFVYMTVLAYLGALVVYQIGGLFV
ncbi:MAG: ferrous iron transport protein B [Gemmataceae bacterium]|nr:ferrous iron transport protein B [Gemmataceae bacterium]MCI0738173.1 ferrous iron transport protein B [Gemmataceae bacterium]